MTSARTRRLPVRYGPGMWGKLFAAGADGGAPDAAAGGRERASPAGQLPSITWTTDGQLRLTSYLHPALSARGVDPTQFLGRPLSERFGSEPESAALLAAHRRALAGEAAEFELCSGSRVYLGRVQPVVDATGEVTGCMGVAVDGTREAEEREQARRADRFRQTLAVFWDEFLNSAYDESFFQRISDVAVNILPAAQAASIWLRSEDEGTYSAVAAHGFDTDAYEGITFTDEELEHVFATANSFQESLHAFRNSEPELMDRLRRAGPLERIQSFLSTPVSVHGRTVAYFHFHNYERREAFGSEAREMAHLFASQLGSLLQRASLEEELRHERDALAALLGEYRKLAAFGAEIETVHDTDSLIGLGMNRLLETLGFDGAIFADVEEREVRIVRTAGATASDPAQLDRQSIPRNGGSNWQAVEQREAVFVHDYAAWPEGLEYYRDLGIGSILTLPVMYLDRVRHVMSFFTYGRKSRIPPEAIGVAELFVKRLENAFERVLHLNETMATRDATFRALGLALEHRDLETSGHIDRVVGLARSFGRRLGLRGVDLQALVWGAYLHDIGKLSVPDRILLKPGPLDDAEYGIMRRHTLYGLELTKGIPFLPTSTRQIIRNHHERWDGGGYPDGLAGERIPLLARMFTLIDVFDALISHRPYKESWTREASLAELERQAGTQFDPELVGEFVALLAEQRHGT